MRVYLAAAWKERAMMPEIARQFEKAGHQVTHRWWEYEEPPGCNYPSNDESPELEDIAASDYIGVVQCDALVLLNTQKSEGKAVETGIAIALGKPIILVGTRSNIFHYCGCVYPVFDVVQAIEWLA